MISYESGTKTPNAGQAINQYGFVATDKQSVNVANRLAAMNGLLKRCRICERRVISRSPSSVNLPRYLKVT